MSNDRIEEIDTTIARLQFERERLLKKKNAPWPRMATLYIGSSEQDSDELGEKIGLSDNALKRFALTCDEVAIELEVNEDGSSHIVSVDGKKLQKT